MGAPQYEQAGADIGGTGTTNTIPRWTAASTLGDSGLIDDGSVIYTTARNAAFGSTSSAGYRARVLAAAGAGSAFGLRIDAGTNSTDYALRIANQATTSDYLAVRGDGNVGIGTVSPASRLDVAGTITCDDAGTGLKLPATPGNADTQTLDCYQEGTWAPTLAGFGGTNPTVTASYTRVGRLVTIAVQIDATGGNQYSMTLGTTTITTPAGMTASSICAVPVVDGGVANRGIASVWTTGIIYLPTVALTTASTFFVATYRV